MHRSSMDQLPAEIVIYIAKFLEACDIVRLYLVSKRLYKIARGNELWKTLCFENSYSETFRQRQGSITNVPIPITEPRVFDLRRVAARLPTTHGERSMLGTLNGEYSGSHLNTASATESKLSANSDGEHARAMANWDPSYPTEDVDWYGEYISRHAPISLDWLQQPIGDITGPGEKREVRGFGLLTDIGSKVVAPLDDGSICLWNIGTADAVSGTKPGGIIARSRPGLLSAHDPNSSSRSVVCEMKTASAAVVESVSVDNASNKAYFALQNILNEVDLNTLQVVSHSRYPFPISALSDIVQPVPLTVGTSCTIHIKDFRLANDAQWLASTGLERLDRIATFPASPKHPNDFHRLLSGDQQLNYAPLVHSSPLSILHSSSSGGHNSNEGEIHVAGRFPSILTYDRRTFPKLRNTIHSGARLCSMACLPYPFASPERDFMQKKQPSVYAAREAKSLPGKTLIACGEYNGKGSLELYGLSNEPAPSPSSSTSPPPGQPQISSFKNRVSASKSKLLSVAAHGTRLVFSDGDGMLKWVERDGRTLVRRWNINKYHQQHTRGLFLTSTRETGSGDVVRKILPTASLGNGGRATGDDLLLWTGERIALLGFRTRPAFGADAFEEGAESVEEREERIYGQTMRRALERQADEVRFVRGLGLGNRGP